jgi:hypothetical protein
VKISGCGFVGVHLGENTKEPCDWWVLGEMRILANTAQHRCEGTQGSEVSRPSLWNILVISYYCFILVQKKKILLLYFVLTEEKLKL